MDTYILFLYGMYNNFEEIENLYINKIKKQEFLCNTRCFVEDKRNIVVVFESEKEYNVISDGFYKILGMDENKFYFIFNRDTAVTAHIPQEVKNILFTTEEELEKIGDDILRIEYLRPPVISNEIIPLNEDDILDKISKHGYDSLSDAEKNHLNNL